MKNWIGRIVKGLLFLLPFLLGSVGLALEGERPLNAMFNTVTMYVLNYAEAPGNWLVQIARWSAPLATASGVALLFLPVMQRLRARLSLLRGDSAVVYGDEELCETLRRKWKKPVLYGTDRVLPAKRCVLFFDEKENMRFYLSHREQLRGQRIYMKSEALRAQETVGDGIRLVSLEECGARAFWRQADLVADYFRAPHGMKIVLIGFGPLGEQLLLWGLMGNVFSPGQHFEYHVFGDAGQFGALYHELDKVGDTVVFHTSDWSGELPLLREADRIIVCGQTDQVRVVQDLLFATEEKVLDVMAQEPGLLHMIEDQKRLRIFPWREIAAEPENLFDDRTLTRAKAINMRYAHIYSGTEETDENSEKEWKKLNSFTRYSNISAADYHGVRLRMLELWNEKPAEDSISREHFELLSELEHERWCRFHYLNNWSRGEPASGKTKDPAKRLHRDLVPYSELSDAEKEKDRDTIRVLLAIR